MGRPTTYTDEIASIICERLMDGESLRAICRDDGMPSCGVVFGWLKDNDAFAEQYTRTRAIQLDVIAEDIVDLSDRARMGEKRTIKADGSIEIVTGDMVDRTRLQIDARKWFLGKLAPKKYGDRVAHDVSIKTPVITGKISDEDAAKAYAEMISGKGDAE